MVYFDLRPRFHGLGKYGIMDGNFESLRVMASSYYNSVFGSLVSEYQNGLVWAQA